MWPNQLKIAHARVMVYFGAFSESGTINRLHAAVLCTPSSFPTAMAANPSSIPPNFPPTVPTRAPGSTQLSMISHRAHGDSLQTTTADPSTVILRPLHQAPDAYGGEVSGHPTEYDVQHTSESQLGQIGTPEKETVKSKFDEKV